MKGVFTVFVVQDIEAARDFYRDHFGFKVVFEADWYVQLHFARDGLPPLELAFMIPEHESLPESFSGGTIPSGVILTIDVADVDGTFALFNTKESESRVLFEPRSEDWGQRHFMFQDVNGLFVDVVQLIEPSADYESAYD